MPWLSMTSPPKPCTLDIEWPETTPINNECLIKGPVDGGFKEALLGDGPRWADI